MRNLQNTRHDKYQFANGNQPELSSIAWDASDDSVLLAFGPTEDSPAITIKRLPNAAKDSSEATTIASWDAPSPDPELAVDRIIDLHCFPDTKSISLVLEGGDVVVIREEPRSGGDLIEIVGSVDSGISAAAWSPDEDLLAVTTLAETLLFMTRDFEAIANITLSPEDVKVSNHVSVGWGKKETQFKGRGVAKTLRDPTMPEHVDEGILSSRDSGEVNITWRGDGQYLAVNGILPTEPKRRIIRVYSREGSLESVSEPVNSLEAAISWKPSGQVIAGIQRCEDRVDVVFFEKNGLRHGEFSLRLNKQELETIGSRINLTWNTDSTVLAVSLKDRVQFWTMSNYHYYLKQEILFHGILDVPVKVECHPEKPLYFICANKTDLRNTSYYFEVCRGSVSPPNDLGIVAVVDGKTLGVTPLRVANTPPPFAFDHVGLSKNALDVAINETGTEIAVLHHGSISLWSCDFSARPAIKSKLKRVVDLGAGDEVVDREIDGHVTVLDHLHARTDHDKISYQRQEPTEPGKGVLFTSKLILREGIEDEVCFNLSEGGVLSVQTSTQTLRISNCTSFVVTPFHLVFTTGKHLLKFVHLRAKELEVPPDQPEDDERCRSVERGARIVTIMPSACSLVLQMPRGNLETIYPRALVLAGVRASIRSKDYKAALLTCRTHRVDMNILYDYLPEQFMANVDLIIKQLKKTEYMDLFLSSLSEIDVSNTIYRETSSPEEQEGQQTTANNDQGQHTPHSTSKVNRVCNAILQALQSHERPRLQNVVTAHICKSPPDLESGLRLVSDLRSQQDQEGLKQAIEHICFLADVNQLYDTALGIYDLDVALVVAQQSQKDPREYLPYLQNLQSMPPMRRQFAIDNDLKRYDKAMRHLHKLDEFEEVKAYMKKHNLYNAAINLYRYDNVRLNELMTHYADYLNSQSMFKEAGVAYEYIADYAAAYQAYRAVNLWQECLTNAMLIPLSEPNLRAVAEDLADALEGANDFKSAAAIHLDHLDDVYGAATLLCKAYDFTGAIRLVLVRGRPDLLHQAVDNGLADAFAKTTELLAEMKSQLHAQIPRLRELRKKKADDPMAFLDGAYGTDGDIPDNLSVAPTDASTSGGTFMTRYTNQSTGTLASNATRKTHKNRRKEERKRARGKKGTVYEEEYLTNSIARLVQRLNAVSEDVDKLIEGLVRRRMRERASAVQAAAKEVGDIYTRCKEEVFPLKSSENSEEQQQHRQMVADERPWGGDGVLWDAVRSIDAPLREAPVLKPLQRLSLLD